MSKVGNALRMLVLLKSRGKMTVKEIADELEIGTRQVERYKEYLDEAGINIKTIPGKYGGYVFEHIEYLSGLDLTEGEFFALQSAEQQLKHDEFVHLQDFKSLVNKICALKKESAIKPTDYFIKHRSANSHFEKEKKIWLDINTAIITYKKIKILYGSLKKEEVERVVRPYAIFQYDGSLYLVGFCERRNEIRQFKLSRISKYEIVNEKFEKDKNFNLKEYMSNNFGIYQDEEIELKLLIKYPMAQIVKEKVWVKNQIITENRDENSILFQAKMKGKVEIKSWILSMGSSVEVLEPETLRNELKKELEEMMKNY